MYRSVYEKKFNNNSCRKTDFQIERKKKIDSYVLKLLKYIESIDIYMIELSILHFLKIDTNVRMLLVVNVFDCIIFLQELSALVEPVGQ